MNRGLDARWPFRALPERFIGHPDALEALMARSGVHAAHESVT
jgi:hypothetical protein